MNKCNSSDVRRFQCSLSVLFLNIHTSLLLPSFQVAQTLQPFFKRMATEFPLKIEPESAVRPLPGGMAAALRPRNQEEEGEGDVRGKKRGEGLSGFPWQKFAGRKRVKKEE